MRRPASLRPAGFDARPHRLHLAGQAGQALAAIGLGLHRREMSMFGLGGGALAVGQLRTGCFKPSPGAFELGEELPLGRGHLLGLRLQLVGVRATGRRGLDVEMLRAFGGDPHGRADPFGQFTGGAV